jgi:predicted CXXCH cytochrome family protein
LIRTRLQLAAVATVLAMAYVAWGFFTPGGADQHSHGEVAAMHATWASQCSACHEDFAPIRDDAAFAVWHWPGQPRPWGHASDAKCSHCHAGPAHVAREKPEEVASCASCHREHQGSLASLTRMDDRHCTRCHASLANPTATAVASRVEFEAAPLAQTITSWIADHPDFRSLKHDPGRIEFTHGRHMTEGLRAAPDDRVQMKLGDLPADDRDRYRRPGQSDTDLIQLDCASCHRSDASGKYMLPVSYEQHCRACHPLTIDPQQPAELLPHGLSPDRIRRDLLGRLSESLLQESPQEWKELLRPVPSRQGERPPREPLDLLSERVLKTERHLRHACDKCHELRVADPDIAKLPESLVDTGLSSLMDAVQPPAVPDVWLRHARFDHAAHRFVDCRQCHARAYADHPQASKSHTDVLIAGRETCLSCHSPRTRDAGGARHDCAECHHYHAADHRADQLHKAATAGRGEAP